MRAGIITLGIAAAFFVSGCSSSSQQGINAIKRDGDRFTTGMANLASGTADVVRGTTGLIGKVLLFPFGITDPAITETLGGAAAGALLGGSDAGKGALVGAGVGLGTHAVSEYTQSRTHAPAPAPQAHPQPYGPGYYAMPHPAMPYDVVEY